MKQTLIACILALGGCAGVHYEPCADAGVPIEEDAGPPMVDDAGTLPLCDGELDSIQACQLVSYAARHLGEPAGEEACYPACPWRGSTGPGLPPPQRCNLARVLECVNRVAGVNECPWLAGTIAECDVEACR